MIIFSIQRAFKSKVNLKQEISVEETNWQTWKLVDNHPRQSTSSFSNQKIPPPPKKQKKYNFIGIISTRLHHRSHFCRMIPIENVKDTVQDELRHYEDDLQPFFVIDFSNKGSLQ